MMQSWYGQSLGLTPGVALGLGFIAIIIGLIVIVLKGYALWHAAKRDEKWWFIILLVVNTLGILELIYLFFVVGKWHKVVGAGSSTPSTPSSTPSNPTPQV